ncbi:MAG: hypothetical protein WAT92_00255 [Saprospiraceae bacterium]
MKAQFEFLSHDVYFDRFTLVKSIDNTFVKAEIQTDIKFTGDDHVYLFGERLAGSDKEIGTLTHDCENQVFEKDVFISHNEGTFDLKRCVTTKKIKFGNPLDCLIGVNKVNIFDYPAGITNSVQGNLTRNLYGLQKYIFLGNYNQPYTLDQIISEVGAIPDRTSIGYAIESITVSAVPETTLVVIESGGSTNSYERYNGHNCKITVSYVGSFSTTKFNDDWLEDPNSPGNYWLNPSFFPVNVWGAPSYAEFLFYNESNVYDYYVQTIWNLGQINLYSDIGISNTVRLNDVLVGLFTCTGLDLISNFLGINPDGSEPSNKYYDFSTSYCKDVKIAQSFDIIRESALEDSFGKSGFLTGKEILTDVSLFFNMMLVPDLTLGIIRWEHVSYFQTKGYDLTSRTDVEIAPLESDKDEIDSELFLMAQPTTDEFYKIKIKYNVPDLYKEENEQKYQIKKFLTDVFSTLNNSKYEGSEYESLFYLLSTDGDNIISLNNQFSINSIFRNLHDINRPYKDGQVADNYINFSGFSIGLETTIKFLSSVITWDNLFPLMSVKTNLGTFKVESVETNEKGLITLKVKK